LSGGWRQRLNLAVALVHRPDLLLLDEPTSALDLQARQALWPILRQRCEAGTALLLATHDMAEAGRLCTRIGLLDAGRIVAEGTPAELVARVPGSAVATLQAQDEAAAQARAAHCGWPVRHWDEGLSLLLPAGVGLRDVVEALAGLDIRAVGVQPVALAHAYLELTQAGSQRVQLAMLGAP
jgi:ABC-2 type transport system ATP-binding protein